MKKIPAFAKALFRRKKQDPIQALLNRVPTVERLIEFGLLYVDPVRAFVVIDASLHIGLTPADDVENRKYTLFFETLRGYINLRRGADRIKTPLLPTDAVHFSVVYHHTLLYDSSLNEPIVPPQVVTQTFYVGVNQDGRTRYEEPDRETAP